MQYSKLTPQAQEELRALVMAILDGSQLPPVTTARAELRANPTSNEVLYAVAAAAEAATADMETPLTARAVRAGLCLAQPEATRQVWALTPVEGAPHRTERLRELSQVVGGQAYRFVYGNAEPVELKSADAVAAERAEQELAAALEAKARQLISAAQVPLRELFRQIRAAAEALGKPYTLQVDALLGKGGLDEVVVAAQLVNLQLPLELQPLAGTPEG